MLIGDCGRAAWPVGTTGRWSTKRPRCSSCRLRWTRSAQPVDPPGIGSVGRADAHRGRARTHESPRGRHLDEPETRSGRSPQDRQRSSSGRRGASCVAMVLAAALVAGAVVFAFGSLRSLLPGDSEGGDFDGPGHGEVEVEISSGSSGSEIGETLVEAGVVKSTSRFTEVAAAQPEKASAIQPGTYAMLQEMPAADAFDRLLDPENRVAKGITIPEGLWRSEIYERLSEETEISVEEYEKAEKSSELKLPEEAGGRIEGWLFPSTYEFEDDTSAVEQLNEMIAMSTDELKKAKVPREDWGRTLTVASIVEGEAG